MTGHAQRSVQERIVDALVYLLAQGERPSTGNWWAAIDDLFGEFPEPEREKLVAAGKAMLARRSQSCSAQGYFGPGGW